jgi:hypothetical protein
MEGVPFVGLLMGWGETGILGRVRMLGLFKRVGMG